MTEKKVWIAVCLITAVKWKTVAKKLINNLKKEHETCTNPKMLEIETLKDDLELCNWKLDASKLNPSHALPRFLLLHFCYGVFFAMHRLLLKLCKLSK